MIKTIPLDQKYERRYFEIPQSSGLLYKFADRNMQIYTSQMKCRDFFNDIIFNIHYNADIRVYGFQTIVKDINSMTLNDDVNLLIKSDEIDILNEKLLVLNQFMEQFGFSHSELIELDISKDQGWFWLKYDTKYIMHNTLFSLYTLLIRGLDLTKKECVSIGMLEDLFNNEIGNNQFNYTFAGWSTISQIDLKKYFKFIEYISCPTIITNNLKTISRGFVHNSGICYLGSRWSEIKCTRDIERTWTYGSTYKSGC